METILYVVCLVKPISELSQDGGEKATFCLLWSTSITHWRDEGGKKEGGGGKKHFHLPEVFFVIISDRATGSREREGGTKYIWGGPAPTTYIFPQIHKSSYTRRSTCESTGNGLTA